MDCSAVQARWKSKFVLKPMSHDVCVILTCHRLNERAKDNGASLCVMAKLVWIVCALADENVTSIKRVKVQKYKPKSKVHILNLLQESESVP